MSQYELTVLYHPDLEIDLDKALKKVEKILSDNEGSINKLDNWGKRKLAYTIKKQDHAIYVIYDVELPNERVQKVEGVLNITDEVLRYLIVKPGPEIEEVPADTEVETDTEKDEAKDDEQAKE